jgi:hypothetical protein
VSERGAFRMAFVPGLIALAVTLLRLAGERLSWSEALFSRATGGLVPAGGLSWLVGITWLALPFGAWFGWRLRRQDPASTPAARAIGMAALALVVLYGGSRLLPLFGLGFPGFLFAIWTLGVAAAVVAWRAWPTLGRVLVAYGLLSRVVVALVMLLAMRGQWGTHYDYADMPGVRELPFWTAYVMFALVPQVVFWVAYTVVLGMVAGTVSAALLRSRTA